MYSWISKSSAIAQLQARLYGSSLWSSDEIWSLLTESLRHWNAITETWPVDYLLTNANGSWVNLATATGTPRARTVTDSDLFTAMEYRLLEPPTGGTWTGTNQFSITDLQNALQSRLQETIQATASNLGLISIPSTPGVRRLTFDDTVLQPRRLRFLAATANTTATSGSGSSTVTVASATGISVGNLISGANIQGGTFATSISGTTIAISQPTLGALNSTAVQFSQPYILTREDTQAFQYFEPDYLQTNAIPLSWSMVSESPLTIDADTAPNVAGSYDLVTLTANATLAPPAATVLGGIPNDWSWLPMYGSLADVLSREPEATDRQRAAYCLTRYTQGLDMMRDSNWLLQAQINGVPCDTPSLAEADIYNPSWQNSSQILPCVVQAGMDFVAPTPGYGQTIGLTLVENAPLLDDSGTYVQVSRDDWVSILNYAQHAATFKLGGSDFSSTMPLLEDFYRAAQAVNRRLLKYGLFSNILRSEGQRQEKVELR